MQSQSSSSRDYVQILLVFSNQFQIIGYVGGITIPLRLPTVLAQGSLRCREGLFTRDTVGDIRRMYQNRRTSLLIRRSTTSMINEAMANYLRSRRWYPSATQVILITDIAVNGSQLAGP